MKSDFEWALEYAPENGNMPLIQTISNLPSISGVFFNDNWPITVGNFVRVETPSGLEAGNFEIGIPL